MLSWPAMGLQAQMVEGSDTIYGNEWIDYRNSYFKIKIGADGVYRIPFAVLEGAGMPVSDISTDDFVLYWMGKPQRIIVSPGNYLEFYGQRNRSELDRHLFERPEEEMLNPHYSLHADTSVYFLTWQSGNHPRFSRIENDLDGNLPSRTTFYRHEELLVLTERHFKPLINTQGVRFSHYMEGEGFGTAENTAHSFSLPVSDPMVTGPSPKLSFRMAGNTQPHEVTIKWNGQDIFQQSFLGSNNRGGTPLIDTALAVPIKEGNNVLDASTSGGSDRILFGTVGISYARQLQFNGETDLTLHLDEARAPLYLELEGLTANENYFAYDLSGGYVLPVVLEGTTGRIHLPAGPDRRMIRILSSGELKILSQVEAVDFTDFSSSQAEFIMISNPTLYDDGAGNNWVQEYANYRQTELGGSYRTQIVDIHQLVDQFAYGVAMHPLSVKNFTNYIAKNWVDPSLYF